MGHGGSGMDHSRRDFTAMVGLSFAASAGRALAQAVPGAAPSLPDVKHRYMTANGIRHHIAEQGSGPLYRHRFGNAPGDPALEPIEQRAAAQPPITVPTLVLQGEGDGVGTMISPPVAGTQVDAQARFFTGPYRRRLLPAIGHDVPQEAPAETAAAVLELLRSTS